MAKSQNGYAAIKSGSDKNLKPLPWITGRVRKGATYTVLNYVASQFNARVEKINPAHSWAYNYRAIRGATTGLSNHSSGTAIDLNAPKHPLGKRGTFTRRQQREIEKILKEVNHSIRWGGHYSARADEQHFEVNVGTAKLAIAAAKVTGKKVVQAVTGKTPPKKPSVTPSKAAHTVDVKTIQTRLKAAGYAVKVTGKDDSQTRAGVRAYQTGQLYRKLAGDGQWGKATEQHFRWVSSLQTALNKYKGTRLTADGDYRARTANRVKEWQTRNKGGAYRGVVDGDPGAVTCKALNIKVHP